MNQTNLENGSRKRTAEKGTFHIEWRVGDGEIEWGGEQWASIERDRDLASIRESELKIETVRLGEEDKIGFRVLESWEGEWN